MVLVTIFSFVIKQIEHYQIESKQIPPPGQIYVNYKKKKKVDR